MHDFTNLAAVLNRSVIDDFGELQKGQSAISQKLRDAEGTAFSTHLWVVDKRSDVHGSSPLPLGLLDDLPAEEEDDVKGRSEAAKGGGWRVSAKQECEGSDVTD